MLDDMKAVKMLGLSGVMSDIVQGLRRSEIEKSEIYRRLMSWNIGLCEIPTQLVPNLSTSSDIVLQQIVS